ncbi:MAG: ArnT family glycosyltransferase [Ktedonobacterales bacterium]
MLAFAAVYRLALSLRGWPGLDSDEAIVGLMARHILLRGEHPIFFYGQYYLGPLQAYAAALMFAFFGSSQLTLRLVVLPLTIGFFAAMYALGRAAYGRAVGLLVLTWLALGPPYATLRELVAVGGHQEMLLFAALLLLGVWDRLRQPAALPQTRRERYRATATYAAIGLLAGLGLWADLLILPVLLVSGVALCARRRRELFSVCGAVLLLGFCIGASPYIIFNVTHDNASYKQVVRQSRPAGRESSWPTPQEWQQQIGETLAVALPLAFGSPHVCVTQGDIWSWYPPSGAENTHSAGPCNNANIVFSLAIISLYLLTAWQIFLALRPWLQSTPARLGRLRLWLVQRGLLRPGGESSNSAPVKGGRGASSDNVESGVNAEVAARLWLQAMLLGIAAFNIFAYASSIDAQRYQFTAARYFLPLYLTIPLLFGQLWATARPLASRLMAVAVQQIRLKDGSSLLVEPSWKTKERPRLTSRSVVATLALAALFALAIQGATRVFVYAGDAERFGLPMPPADRALIAFLDTHHITRYYSDYWTCYRIAFESDERAICAVRGQDGEPDLMLMNNRYTPYITALAATPTPAYILPAGTAEDTDFIAETSARGLPNSGYTRVVTGEYAIYYHP